MPSDTHAWPIHSFPSGPRRPRAGSRAMLRRHRSAARGLPDASSMLPRRHTCPDHRFLAWCHRRLTASMSIAAWCLRATRCLPDAAPRRQKSPSRPPHCCAHGDRARPRCSRDVLHTTAPAARRHHDTVTLLAPGHAWPPHRFAHGTRRDAVTRETCPAGIDPLRMALRTHCPCTRSTARGPPRARPMRSIRRVARMRSPARSSPCLLLAEWRTASASWRQSQRQFTRVRRCEKRNRTDASFTFATQGSRSFPA